MQPQNKRRDWPAILEHAAGIVHSYDDRITLRQLFYRLVADGTLANVDTSYKGLSRETAKARRGGDFPRLLDRTRSVDRAIGFGSPEQAREWLRGRYRRDAARGSSTTFTSASRRTRSPDCLRPGSRNRASALSPPVATPQSPCSSRLPTR